MRITFFSNFADPCGIADYSRNLLEELKLLVNLRVVEAPTLGSCSYLCRAINWRRLGKELNDGNICHIQHEYSFWGGCRPLQNYFPYFQSSIKIPVVMTAHEVLSPPYIMADVQNPFSKLLIRPLMPLSRCYSAYVNKGIFAWAQKVLVHTVEQRQTLVARGVNSENVLHIPHGIPEMGRVLADERVIDKFNLKHKRLITIIGFISERKGYDLVIDVLPKVPDDILFVIAGSSRLPQEEQYEQKLRTRIENEGLSNRVIFTGYLSREEQKAMLGHTIIVLAPFTAVSGSGSLSLALAGGKCIVAADLPSLIELNNESKSFMMFRCGDSKDLLQKIKVILENPCMRQDLESAARAYAARTSFAWMAGRIAEIYAGILKGK